MRETASVRAQAIPDNRPYLLSNAYWIGYALSTSATGLAVQQAVFTLTSLIGVWRWLVVPARKVPIN